MQKIDSFLLNIKYLYPNFKKPTPLEHTSWEELIAPYSVEEIILAIKKWKKSHTQNAYPTIQEFKNFLQYKQPPSSSSSYNLPFNPETYLMDQDIKSGRCKHLYPTYCKAVNYILNDRLKEFYPYNDFKKFNYSTRYKLAVDHGLFADFENTLDFIKERTTQHG